MAAVTPGTLPNQRGSPAPGWSPDSLGAAPGELVLAAGAVRAGPLLAELVGGLRGEIGERPVDLLPDPAERDPEHALPAGQQVHHLGRGGALVHADAVAHEGEPGQVPGAAVPQVVDGRADLLQRDTGVEQALDHLEHQDVAEAVEPLRARPVRGPDAGLHQAGARPVVELAVGDPGGGAGGRPAVPDVLGTGGEILAEQETLLAGALDRRAVTARLAAVLLGYRHTRLRPGAGHPGYSLRTLGRPARWVNDPPRRVAFRSTGRSPPD